jgi:hypothetical protein
MVDDSTDCLVAYEIIAPHDCDISSCTYLQPEPDRIENLAISESRKFENERKARSSSHQAPTPLVQWGRGMQRRIQTKPTIAHGSAWQVETRASVRRQQEQEAQQVDADNKAKQIKIELKRLEDEARQTQASIQKSIPQAILTSN